MFKKQSCSLKLYSNIHVFRPAQTRNTEEWLCIPRQKYIKLYYILHPQSGVITERLTYVLEKEVQTIARNMPFMSLVGMKIRLGGSHSCDMFSMYSLPRYNKNHTKLPLKLRTNCSLIQKLKPRPQQFFFHNDGFVKQETAVIQATAWPASLFQAIISKHHILNLTLNTDLHICEFYCKNPIHIQQVMTCFTS
jgi:hypothetical protein